MRKDEGGAGPEGVKGRREEAGVGTQEREVECSPRKRGGFEMGQRMIRRPSATLNVLPGRLQSSSRHWKGYRRNKIQPLSCRCLQSSWEDETYTH